ncbi:hypothetical protein ACLKA6_015923 [Drosophila palustris]
MTGAAQDRFRTVLGHLPPRLYINHGQHTFNANTERDKTNKLNYHRGYYQAMVQTLHSRTATNRNKRILRCQKKYRGLLTHRRASRTPLHSLRDYGPPFVPHKTSEVSGS